MSRLGGEDGCLDFRCDLWTARARGRFDGNACQPIRFETPEFLMDNDGVALGFKGGRKDLAMYASITRRNGRNVLWYPERKFFLLGKEIS